MNGHGVAERKPLVFSIYQVYEDGIKLSPEETGVFEQVAVSKRQQLSRRAAATAAGRPWRRCLLFSDGFAPECCLNVSTGLKLQLPKPPPPPPPPEQPAASQSTPCMSPCSGLAPETGRCPAEDEFSRRLGLRTCCNGSRADAPAADAAKVASSLYEKRLSAPIMTAVPAAISYEQQIDVSPPPPPQRSLSETASRALGASTTAGDSSIVPLAEAESAPCSPNGGWRQLILAPPLWSDGGGGVCDSGSDCQASLLHTFVETLERMTNRKLPGDDGADLFELDFSQRRRLCWRFYLLPAPLGGSWQCFAELALRDVDHCELEMVDAFATRYACPAPEVVLYHWQHLWQTERKRFCLLPPSRDSVRHILERLGRHDLAELMLPPPASTEATPASPAAQRTR